MHFAAVVPHYKATNQALNWKERTADMPVSFMMLTRQEKELESEIINPTASREGSVSDMLRKQIWLAL